ncbi:MAG: hypothetical protein RIC03_15620 [Cyclobacteriaceae bacterium]
MDDIQFWLYIVFGIIYFVGRFLKKKNKPEELPETETTERRPQRSKTFEELLSEFTDEKAVESAPDTENKVRPVKKSKPVISEESIFEEGSTRRFSDEESKKIYEASIKKAEGIDLDFAPAEHFKSKIQREISAEVSSRFASSIREGLKDPEEAKKAVIYAEIFNRKY